jgi:tetratricopeptide (TPR) repeat protein
MKKSPPAAASTIRIPGWLEIAVALVAVACYLNSLPGDFVFDDLFAVKNNPDLRPETPLAELFAHDFWGTPIDSPESHKAYRPLTVLSYRLNYLLGELDPLGYHLLNALLHGAVCLMLLPMSTRLAGSLRAAVVATLLFATHPVHTEAVANLVGRAELLCTVFYLAGFQAFTRAAGAKGTRWHWFILAQVCLVGATLAKETGLTLVGLWFAYDLLYRPREGSTLPRRAQVVRRQAIIVGLGLGYLVLRKALLGEALPHLAVIDNPVSAGTLSERWLTYAYIHARYAWLLLWPVKLCADYAYLSIPLVQSVADPRNLATLACYGGLIGMVVVTWRSPRRQFYLCCLSWLILPLLPVAHIFFQAPTVIAERALYLPSVGFCLLVAQGLEQLARHGKNHQRLALVTVACLLLCYAGRTFVRNQDWRTEERLFRSVLDVFPHNVKAHVSLGVIHRYRDQYDAAVGYFRQALAVKPDYDDALYYLGQVRSLQGKPAEAESWFRRALAANPGYTAVHIDLGVLLAQRKQHAEAIVHFKQALRLDPGAVNARKNLGHSLVQSGNPEEAARQYQGVLVSQPDDGGTLIGLGYALKAMGDLEGARDIFTRAAALPAYAEVARAELAKIPPQKRGPE